ncbi:MAG: hypothetical protein JSS61_05965 [Verrucomicrobia bacterium]|nr:hypothetical protein [Verrucomicrobiota bacterium]
MKYYLILLTVTLLAGSFACAEEMKGNTNQMKPQYHRFSVGTDAFFDHAESEICTGFERVKQTANAVLLGIKVGYDYLKPNTFYFGTDGLLAMGRSYAKHDEAYLLFSCNRSIKLRSTPLMANIEQRYGYTFQSPILTRSTLIPFIGMGWYLTRPQFDDSFSSNWCYSAVGLRVNQKFSDRCNIGFHVKAMYAFAGNGSGTIEYNLGKEDIKNSWGYEMEFPFSWYLGYSRRWGVQFQPYLLKFDVNRSDMILGARLLATYDF